MLYAVPNSFHSRFHICSLSVVGDHLPSYLNDDLSKLYLVMNAFLESLMYEISSFFAFLC